MIIALIMWVKKNIVLERHIMMSLDGGACYK